MKTATACLLALVALGPATAAASLIEFEYEFGSGAVLAGEVSGTFLGDNDTFVVDTFGTVTLNNIVLNAIGAGDVCSGADFPRCGNSPLMSLSGSVMDIFVCTLGFNRFGNCSFARDGGFFFSTVGPYQFARAGAPGAGFHTDYPVRANRWSANRVDVPEPATLALLGLGLMAIPFLRGQRRRSTLRAAAC